MHGSISRRTSRQERFERVAPRCLTGETALYAASVYIHQRRPAREGSVQHETRSVNQVSDHSPSSAQQALEKNELPERARGCRDCVL